MVMRFPTLYLQFYEKSKYQKCKKFQKVIKIDKKSPVRKYLIILRGEIWVLQKSNPAIFHLQDSQDLSLKSSPAYETIMGQ